MNACKQFSAVRKHLCFAAAVVGSATLFWKPLASLLRLSFADERYSHTPFIPVLTAGMVYLQRERIFKNTVCSPVLGATLLMAGILLAGSSACMDGSLFQELPTQIFSVVFVWAGAFATCYGAQSLQAAAFPALFLLLTIPLPAIILEKFSLLLQSGSASLSYTLFNVLGVPVFRHGFMFSLPGVTIEIAEQCSGIRSSTALIISSVLVSYLFLRAGRSRLALILATGFVAMFKNAVRIVSLATLAAYVDGTFLHGVLHHRYGGTFFSVLAIGMIAPVFLALRKSERAPKKREVHPIEP